MKFYLGRHSSQRAVRTMRWLSTATLQAKPSSTKPCAPLELVSQLERLLGNSAVSTATSVCSQHGMDESFRPPQPPTVVTFPRSTEEVSAIARVCAEWKTPIIPFGTGTGLEAGVSCPQGGVSIDLMGMDAIREVNEEDGDCLVEPGVKRTVLNTHLRTTGLYFPVDPGADASLCGMAATSASGTMAVKYGTMKENVMGLEVVLADGTIIHTAGPKGRAPKSVAGLNLTNLFVGSEGTLGIITAARLKLHALPACISAAVCAFPTVNDATQAVIDITQMHLPVARMELLDAAMMEAVNKHRKTDHAIMPHLFLEFHGFSEESMAEQIEAAQDIAESHHGQTFKMSTAPEERTKLWDARHNALYSVVALRPNTRAYSTDVCVPISKLSEMVLYATEQREQLNLIAPIAGHVGDGNFHCLVSVNQDDPDEVKRVHELSVRLAKRAIELGGTCTGEHGIGVGKREFLEFELGKGTVSAMHAIKKALDPFNIMNPGKVYPIL
eukprot:m.4371 g.4371  ORF g.4371 m.4371 type:complete len:498 (-) comp4480_c0_seq1:343-1836(-)